MLTDGVAEGSTTVIDGLKEGILESEGARVGGVEGTSDGMSLGGESDGMLLGGASDGA